VLALCGVGLASTVGVFLRECVVFVGAGDVDGGRLRCGGVVVSCWAVGV
jgi:hypothetical protein